MPAFSGARASLDLSFLKEIHFVQAILEFEALDDVEMPPFGGSALRGVLGEVFRNSLCERRPPCEAGCADPARCAYHAIFERDRAAPGPENGKRANLPRAIILDVPAPPELERLAMGGPVRFPYELRKGGAPGDLPVLENRHPNLIPAGYVFTARLTLLGQTAALLPAALAVLLGANMHMGAGRFRLLRALDAAASGRALCDSRLPGIPVQAPFRQNMAGLLDHRASAGRVQVCFVTPLRLRFGDGYCFSAEGLAARFWEACLTRAMRVRDAFCAARRLPWMDLPETRGRVVRHRLFHYALPRLSHRQRAFMNFDGLVGSLWLEGDFQDVLPLERAAEILHIGQKGSFGLGQVRCYSQ